MLQDLLGYIVIYTTHSQTITLVFLLLYIVADWSHIEIAFVCKLFALFSVLNCFS